MTRKDYVLIAAALRGALSEASMHPGVDKMNGVKLAAFYLSEKLAKDNPRFDRERFLLAAVVPS